MHNHALALTLIEAALARDDWRYLALIGSKSKRAQFERRLVARGFSAAAIARVRCPIGTEGVAIKAKHPGAIAVAIAAELLVVREATARRANAPHNIERMRKSSRWRCKSSNIFAAEWLPCGNPGPVEASNGLLGYRRTS